MKENLVLIMKGLIIGIGKVIPGVSGSLLAITLGVYEKSINILSDIFKSFYKNIMFLGFLGIGILISIIFGSRIIANLLSVNYFLTMSFFVGLIVGTVPNLLCKIIINKKTDYIYIIISIFLIYLLEIITYNNKIIINKNIYGYLFTILIGFIDAATMIVPGISGTAIFILIGCYEFVLNLFSNFFSQFMIFFIMGLIIGIIVISKFINYLFKNKRDHFYLVILGLVLASIYYLLKNVLSNCSSLYELIIGVILFIVGFFISKIMNNMNT